MSKRVFVIMLIFFYLMIDHSVLLLIAESNTDASENLLSIYMQNDQNKVHFMEEVYSLRNCSDSVAKETDGVNLLDADEDYLVYSSSPDQDGFIEYFSHDSRSIVKHIDFPGEFIYAGEIFQDGLIFIRVPLEMMQGSLKGTMETKFFLSYLGRDNQVIDLWQGEVIYHIALPRLCSFGDELIFAYDEMSAENANDIRAEKVCRIGIVSENISISWLLCEPISYTKENSQFRYSLRPIRACEGIAHLLYYRDDDSIIYTYDSRTKELSSILIPSTI